MNIFLDCKLISIEINHYKSKIKLQRSAHHPIGIRTLASLFFGSHPLKFAVVSIDLFLFFFMLFLYTRVCFRANYTIPPPPHSHWFPVLSKQLLLFLRLLLFMTKLILILTCHFLSKCN